MSVNILTISRVAILAIVYLYYVTTFVNTSNAGVAITVAIALQQWELSYSLVSTTIPTLKNFLRGFHTGMGLDLGSTMSQYGHGSKRRRSNIYDSLKGNSGSYELKERSKDRTGPVPTKRSAGNALQNFRPDPVDNTTSVVHPDHRRSASADRSHMTENSQEMFIHHQVDFEVRFD